MFAVDVDIPFLYHVHVCTVMEAPSPFRSLGGVSIGLCQICRDTVDELGGWYVKQAETERESPCIYGVLIGNAFLHSD